jgi:hypothetical protein
MAAMRFLARWSLVRAFCAAVVGAAVQPVLGHGARGVASAATTADAAGTTSGFTSTPAPEKPAFIGPVVAMSGPTIVGAIVASQFLIAWRLPGRESAAFSPALRAPRLAPHLRSTPLLI